jgi:hypothetical protein
MRMVMLADSHNILNRWKNYFSQLLNVHNVNEVRQTEVHTAELLVLGPSRLEVEIAIPKFKKYKSPGSGHIPAELILVGGEILRCNNYRGIWLLSTSYKILSNILLSRLVPYVD